MILILVTSAQRSAMLSMAHEHMNVLASRERNAWMLPGYAHMESLNYLVACSSVNYADGILLEITSEQRFMLTQMIHSRLHLAEEGLISADDATLDMLSDLFWRLTVDAAE